MMDIATREVKEDIFLAVSNALIHKNGPTIHFYVPHAKRVAKENWHPEKKGAFLENGIYELQFPSNLTQVTHSNWLATRLKRTKKRK